jgi:hypothetical protein
MGQHERQVAYLGFGYPAFGSVFEADVYGIAADYDVEIVELE